MFFYTHYYKTKTKNTINYFEILNIRMKYPMIHCTYVLRLWTCFWSGKVCQNASLLCSHRISRSLLHAIMDLVEVTVGLEAGLWVWLSSGAPALHAEGSKFHSRHLQF